MATQETAINGYYYVITASWVPYHIHTTRSDLSTIPLYVELGFSTPEGGEEGGVGWGGGGVVWGGGGETEVGWAQHILPELHVKYR